MLRTAKSGQERSLRHLLMGKHLAHLHSGSHTSLTSRKDPFSLTNYPHGLSGQHERWSTSIAHAPPSSLLTVSPRIKTSQCPKPQPPSVSGNSREGQPHSGSPLDIYHHGIWPLSFPLLRSWKQILCWQRGLLGDKSWAPLMISIKLLLPTHCALKHLIFLFLSSPSHDFTL